MKIFEQNLWLYAGWPEQVNKWPDPLTATQWWMAAIQPTSFVTMTLNLRYVNIRADKGWICKNRLFTFVLPRTYGKAFIVVMSPLDSIMMRILIHFQAQHHHSVYGFSGLSVWKLICSLFSVTTSLDHKAQYLAGRSFSRFSVLIQFLCSIKSGVPRENLLHFSHANWSIASIEGHPSAKLLLGCRLNKQTQT